MRLEINKVEKDISIYKHEFDKLALHVYGDHYLDRKSLDLENLSFRIHYMIRHGMDVEQIKDRYIHEAYETNRALSRVIHVLLTDVMGVDDANIIDFMTVDMDIDSVMVKFKLVVISSDPATLRQIEELPELVRIYPDEFFRITTESYNDAIAKVYPELFEEHHIDVGSGADGDVFCHSITLQVTEGCSLACFRPGTKILMADFTEKDIEDIRVGDMIMGFDEEPGASGKQRRLIPAPVLRTMISTKETYRLSHPMMRDTYVTRDHPFLTGRDEWKEVGDISMSDRMLAYRGDPSTLNEADLDSPGCEDGCFPGAWMGDGCIARKGVSNMQCECMLQEIPAGNLDPAGECGEVYNLETGSHTYIANGYAVHNCSYCYQHEKSDMRMEFSTAKLFIDKLLHDDFGYVNQYNSPAVILEFIGGEPFLETKLIRRIYEYFLDQCYELNHPWFDLHRLSICSNGLAYMDDDVQELFKDYGTRISFNISIDGNKELHDACRVQPNGEGSYDIAMAALNHYNAHYSKERNSKMTLAPQNISYLFDSVVDFIEKGAKSINLNCVFEEGWNQETALIEYQQLKKLSDWLIDNGLENIYLSVFNDRPEDRNPKENDGNFCGGSGSMLALRPNGDLYPCLRYMPSSIGSEDIKMGSIFDKFVERSDDSDILKRMDANTRRSQSNDICYDCPIGNDCANCSALGYEVFKDLNKRTTFTCIQNVAEALANVYYYNRLNIAHPEYDLGARKNNVPPEWALLVIDEDELEELELLESVSMLLTFEQRGGLKS